MTIVLLFDGKSASKDLWTKEVWAYDYRTNLRKETWSATADGRWRKFFYKEIMEGDKTSLDITWLKGTAIKEKPCEYRLTRF